MRWLTIRQPSSCTSEICSICRFVEDMVDTVLDPAAKNAAVEVEAPIPVTMTNKASWRAAQKQCAACKSAYNLLKSGKMPPSKTGELFCNIRDYCREASISADKVLVVKTPPNQLTGNITRQRIVVPQKLLPMILHQMHISTANPPPKILRFYFSLRSCVAFLEALKGFPPFFSHQQKKAIWVLALYFTGHIGHIVVVIYRGSLPELFSRRDR